MVSISKRTSLPLTKGIKTHTLTTQGCIGRCTSITTIIQKALSKKKILLLMRGIKTNMLTNLQVTDGWMIYENMLYNYFKKERSAPHTGRNGKYADQLTVYRQMDRIEHLTTMV
jgi:hypothetical protein